LIHSHRLVAHRRFAGHSQSLFLQVYLLIDNLMNSQRGINALQPLLQARFNKLI
ncbi:MAG: hypothetical protein ACI9LU_003052, partial [Polaribacter sp.]